MPIYEYLCSACSHHFDVIQKMTDEPLTRCPKCQAQAAKRLISAAGFQLKGSGWYATDFKDKPKSNEATSGGQGESKSEKTSSSGECTSVSSGEKKSGESA